MVEVWKQIKDYDDYEVSNQGRVRKNDYYLKQSPNNTGYLRVRLNQKWFFVHRLVALHFCKNEKPQVNHLDGNKLNNNPSNLKWVTQSENLKHAYNMGLSKAYDRRGKNNPNYKHGKRCKSIM
jgi:hypothetical protein